jgi:hypothetical protein
VPVRLLLAVERGELQWDDLAVLGYLHLKSYEHGECAMTLAALLEMMGWDRKREDTLGRILKGLRDSGWLDFESRRGQRKPYVFRLTGAAIGTAGPDLRTTSAPDPPSRAEVTSAERRSEIVAKPDVEPPRPPHDLRSAEVLRREERRKNVDDDLDEQFELAIAPICERGHVGREQRLEWLAAWQENEAGVRQLIAEALLGDRPAGLLTKMVREGAHRTGPLAGADGAAKLTATLTVWIRNVAWGYHDWSTCEDEIAERERSHHVTLTVPQKQTLFELWDSYAEKREAVPA